jgi:hypothetical protein
VTNNKGEWWKGYIETAATKDAVRRAILELSAPWSFCPMSVSYGPLSAV